MKRIGIFLPNWIGDVVMATPAIRALSEHFGDHAELIGIHKPYIADVLAGTSWLDRSITNSMQGRGIFTMVRRIRDEKIDTAVLFTNSLRSALVATLGGAKQRIGFSKDFRGSLLTEKLNFPRLNRRRIPTPALASYLEIVQRMGVKDLSRQTELGTTPADEQRADTIWQNLKLPPADQTIIFHAGGGWGGAANSKAWPTSYFSELARRIATEWNKGVLILCGPKERETAATIAASADHPHVQSLANAELSIGLSKACVKRCRLMVSTDSGPRHFAAAFNVPVVALFGPTHIAWSDTFFDREIQLQEKVDCGPCQKKACPLGHHKCMTNLSVERVFAMTGNLLAATEEGRSFHVA